MKNKITILASIISIFFSINCLAQEEFFSNRAGLSLTNSKQFSSDMNVLGLSYSTKHGFIFSGSYAASYNSEIMTESLGYLLYDHREGHGNTKGLFGLSYSQLLQTDKRFINLGLGVSQVFFPKTNFPFSISGSGSYNKLLNYYHSYYNTYSGYDIGFSIAYTQTFFAKNRIYPLVGITKSFEVTNGKTQSLFLNVGFNIKM